MKHWPVERYVHPDVFDQYKQRALEMGLDFVESAPLVRSSYMADRAAGCLKNKK
jgi:lipoic acid synthetase